MPPSFAVDTNCMVAAVSGWHVHHSAATVEISRRLDRGEQMVIPAHALTEAFSVLSRFPAPHRLGAPEAWELLKHSFVTPGQVVTLTARRHVDVIESLSRTEVGGGRVYDALIGEAAIKAGAATILTYNARHFEAFSDLLAVVIPS